MILAAAEFGQIFPIVIIVVGIVISIASSSGKAKQRKQRQGAKPPVIDASVDNPSAEKTPDEQFDEIVKKMEKQRVDSNEHKRAQQKEKAQRQADKHADAYNHRNNVSSSDDTGSKVITEAFPKEKVVEKNHAHPSDEPKNGEKVKVEKRPSAVGSLGVLQDEGCEEHGDLRFVLDEVESADDTTDADTRELQRLIVWGDILNSPKFKRRHY